MGYDTDFEGSFTLSHPLTKEHHAYLSMFSQTRRVKRNAVELAKLPDLIREAVNLPIGEDGGYFLGDSHYMNTVIYSHVCDFNKPPSSQPGLWCQWAPNENGTAIGWDGNEKFYKYVEWLDYIIISFLKPWGYTLNGVVSWTGEGYDDSGDIIVTDNVVTTSSLTTRVLTSNIITYLSLA